MSGLFQSGSERHEIGTNMGLLDIWFQYILALQDKVYWNLIKQSQICTVRANLIHFCQPSHPWHFGQLYRYFKRRRDDLVLFLPRQGVVCRPIYNLDWSIYVCVYLPFSGFLVEVFNFDWRNWILLFNLKKKKKKLLEYLLINLNQLNK